MTRRVGAGALGTLLIVGLAASPAWATPPDPPAQPSVVRGNAQITVTFTPVVASPTVDTYTATCTDGMNPASNTDTGSPIVVSGLTNGTSYTCSVEAFNIDGPSGPSPDSDPVVPATVPGTPAQPTVTRGNGTLIVTTTPPPAANGDAIDSYTAACLSTNGGPQRNATTASSPITVATPGTSIGKSYYCHVTAHNGVGNSPVSADSTPTVVAASAPDAPDAPVAVSSGDGQLTVTVTPPAANGDAISGYATSCTATGGNPGSASGASSTLTVTGLTNTKSYTCNATATNGLGTGPTSPNSASVAVGVPDAPALPSVTRGNTQITVGFSAPNANGNAITGYNVGCLTSGGPNGVASGTSSPITVVNVANGKTYRCTVTATNAAGISAPSPASGAVVPAGIPDEMAQPTVAPANHGVQVTFVAPADNGSPITSYEVDCTSVDGTPGTATGANSPITVTGLTNGSIYTCSVIAMNDVGLSGSPDSDEVVPLGVPNAPAKPGVVRGNGRIVVSIDTPADNGSPVFSFTAVCTSSTGGVTGSRTGFLSPITVTGLTNTKSYTCRGSATNDNGDGPLSVASDPVIPRAPPAKPTIQSVVSGSALGSAGPLVVAIKAPANNGSPITSYSVTCTRASTGAKTVKTGTGTTITVTGLVTGQIYSCTAIATNAGGNSPPAVAMTGKVGTPGRPTISRVVQQGGKLTLFFLAPSGNGKPITKYSIRCSSTNGGANRGISGTLSPLTVKNLSIAGSYTCVLTATNARGDGAPAKVGPMTIS